MQNPNCPCIVSALVVIAYTAKPSRNHARDDGGPVFIQSRKIKDYYLMSHDELRTFAKKQSDKFWRRELRPDQVPYSVNRYPIQEESFPGVQDIVEGYLALDVRLLSDGNGKYQLIERDVTPSRI